MQEITVTQRAANHIKKCITERGKGLGVKVGVKKNGCSGFAYKLEYVDIVGAEKAFNTNGVTIFVDPLDLFVLNGLTMDYERVGLQEGFSFTNPNETARCGCGESFSVE